MTYTAEQQREHRKLWVEALRSGKYVQARKQLRNGDAMCCLGVACEISGLGYWNGIVYRAGVDLSSSILPTPVQHWLGLEHDNGYMSPENFCLSEMNDNGKSFAELAAIIESEPAGLVV